MKKKNEMMCKEQLFYSQHYPDTFSSIDKKTMNVVFIYSLTSRNEFLLNEIFLIKIERYFCQTKDSKITFGHLL